MKPRRGGAPWRSRLDQTLHQILAAAVRRPRRDRQSPARIIDLKTRLERTQAELRAAYAEIAHGEVIDYVFANLDGPVKLSQLFGTKRDVIIMHSMGVARHEGNYSLPNIMRGQRVAEERAAKNKD